MPVKSLDTHHIQCFFLVSVVFYIVDQYRRRYRYFVAYKAKYILDIFCFGCHIKYKHKNIFFVLMPAYFWQCLNQLHEIVIWNAFPAILNPFPFKLSTCWLFFLYFAVQLIPNHLSPVGSILQVVSHLSVSFLPFSVLEKGKPKRASHQL